MDFTQLYRKIQAIDEGLDKPKLAPSYRKPSKSEIPESDKVGYSVDDEQIEECGGDMKHPPKPPAQADNVNVNVTMSGSGKGGIRDLMDILKNIQDGKDQDHDRPLFGQDDQDFIDEDDYANDLDGVKTHCIGAVTNPASDDLHSREVNKTPRHVDPADPYRAYSESTFNRLKSLYQDYK